VPTRGTLKWLFRPFKQTAVADGIAVIRSHQQVTRFSKCLHQKSALGVAAVVSVRKQNERSREGTLRRSPDGGGETCDLMILNFAFVASRTKTATLGYGRTGGEENGREKNEFFHWRVHGILSRFARTSLANVLARIRRVRRMCTPEACSQISRAWTSEASHA